MPSVARNPDWDKSKQASQIGQTEIRVQEQMISSGSFHQDSNYINRNALKILDQRNSGEASMTTNHILPQKRTKKSPKH